MDPILLAALALSACPGAALPWTQESETVVGQEPATAVSAPEDVAPTLTSLAALLPVIDTRFRTSKAASQHRVSPDGRWLAWLDTPQPAGGGDPSAWLGVQRAVVISPLGGKEDRYVLSETELGPFHGHGPVWAPDAAHLVWTGVKGRYRELPEGGRDYLETAFLDIASPEVGILPTRLAEENHRYFSRPTWCPDGGCLAFASFPSASVGWQGYGSRAAELVILDAEGNPRRITGLPVEGPVRVWTAWSPDGGRVAVATVQKNASILWFYDLIGDEWKEVGRVPGSLDWPLQWSDDASMIALVSGRGDTIAQRRTLWTFRAPEFKPVRALLVEEVDAAAFLPASDALVVVTFSPAIEYVDAPDPDELPMKLPKRLRIGLVLYDPLSGETIEVEERSSYLRVATGLPPRSAPSAAAALSGSAR